MFLIKNKAQAALEFLMTYGWAILAVLAAIASLAYFGVLSPSYFLPEKCTLPSGITCLDFKVGSSAVTVVLQNNLGEPITITSLDVAKKDGDSCSIADTIQLNNNDKKTFIISGCNNGNIKEKFNGDLSIAYTKESGLAHIAQGSIMSLISEGAGAVITSQSICQNAEGSVLCSGLDIVYGVGYEDLCCSEHDLCC